MKSKRKIFTLFCFITICACCDNVSAQLRKIYVDNNNDNQIHKLSFFSASQGYVAFRDWIGYTADSGRTFTKKFITNSNVNYNGYAVNLTFGFSIVGVKAFSQNIVIAYGDYGWVPAILYSSDGGNNFKLVYHPQSNFLAPTGSIEDMVFPQNGNIGYAVEPDCILKTTDKGLTWSIIRPDPGSYLDRLEAVDDNNIIAFTDDFNYNKLLKTTNGGSSWQQVTLPATGKMIYAHFLTAATGWLTMWDNNNNAYLYKTNNGGASWNLQNDIIATPFYCSKMKFIDDNTGYALTGLYTVSKTLNSGVTWEPLPRDNNFSYLGYTHKDLQCLSATQLWAGGGAGFLELSTNGGGTPIPKAYFKIDTTGYAATGNVNLKNYSRTGYTYQWFVNNVPISTTYNSSYAHNTSRTWDSIKLVVSNGTLTDTAIKIQFFNSPVIVSSFTPVSAGIGTVVTIKGSNFSGVTSVTFGGVPAQSFTVVSSTTINATVGTGATGNVTVTTSTGQGSLGGFMFIPRPVVSSFTPTSATAGTTVIIAGNNFTTTTAVTFGNVAASSFVVLSSTVISAITPSGTSGAVKVTTLGGVDSLAGFISLPTITSFTPLAGTQGTILNITGTSFTGTTAVSVGGINVMSFTVNSSTSITAVVGAGASGSVTVTKPGGSSSKPGFTWLAAPVITSFSPASGPVGTTVVITGTGFNTTPANNIVYFGAVKATITAGTGTSLTVTVPVGATFEPITVTNNNLTAYSIQPFLVTFSGGSIGANTFATRTIVSTAPSSYPTKICVGDIDGDSKADLIVSAVGSIFINSGIYIYLNTSTTSSVSFANPVVMGSLGYEGAAVGDLDGDGKLDLALINGFKISIFKNNSVAGSVSFVKGPDLITNNSPSGICIADADGDGKPDIAVSQYPDAIASIFRNTSEPGNLSFAQKVNYTALGGRNILMVDLDADGKPEMIVPNAVDNKFAVLKNNCTKANISFGSPVTFTGYVHAQMAWGDIDGDGKVDLVAGANNASKTAVIRNTSSAGNISFASPMEFNANAPDGIALSDMDGDGKLDICIALYNYSMAAIKNTSTPGNISFSPKQDYIPGTYGGEYEIFLADINGDGKNDAVVTSETKQTISIHVNTVSQLPFIQSFTPTTGSAGTSVTITGSNFSGATAVSFGGIPASSFVVNSASSITAIVGTGTSGDVSVTTPLGIASLGVFNYLPSISSFSPASGSAGTIVTLTGNGFIGTTDVSFGGVAAASFTIVSNTTITAVIGSGMSGNISVSNPAGTTSLGTFTFIPTQPPVITSFTPLSGKTGSTVIITGNNFNSNPAANNVYFGSIKAQVVSASSTSLTVIVPGGAIYDHIMVTTNYLTALSDKYFITTFPGDATFKAKSFNVVLDSLTPISSNSSQPYFIDLNADNKLDIIISSLASGIGISVFKNTSTNNGNISLAPRQDFTLPQGMRKSFIADLDGDGRPDIATINPFSHKLIVMRNISSGNQIKFDTLIQFTTGTQPFSVAVGDLNSDGKPDVAVANYFSNNVSVHINTTQGGSITFAPKIDYPAGNGPYDLKIEDLDGDQKPDIIVGNGQVSFGLPSVSIFRNLSSAGNVSFSPKVDFNLANGIYALITGDVDGDQKSDIITSTARGISIGRNTSTPGSISFAPKVDLSIVGNNSFGVVINDLNGDGKPDISATELSTDSIIVYGNNSSQGNLSFAAGVHYAIIKGGTGITAGDLDGDGKPDLAVMNGQDWPNATISILKNSMVNVVQACPGTITTLTTNLTGTAYQWQQNSGSGFINITDNTTFSGTNSQNLVVNVSTSLNGYEYRCIADGLAGNTISLLVTSTPSAASVTISTLSTNTCSGSSVTFNAVVVNGGSSLVYQWQVNGVNAGVNSNTFLTSSLNNNDQVKVIVTNSSSCGPTATITSNIITMSLSASVAANAGNDQTICSGSTTIGAAPVAGNSYSWTSSPAGFTSSIANPSVSPTVTTTYFLTVTNNGCTAKDTVKVSVGNISANAGNDKTICPGSNTTIGSAASGTNTYSWSSNPAGFTSTSANPAVSPTVTTSYFLVVTNGTCIAKDTVVVNVSASPVANAGPDGTICNGSSYTIGSPAITGYTYSWSPATALNSSIIAQPSANPTVATNYILTVTNTNGCVAVDTVLVKLGAAFSVSLPDTVKTICIGNNTTIGNPSQPGFTYSWVSVPAGFSSILSNPIVSPTTTTTYYLTQTNTAGCQANASVKVIADSCNTTGAKVFPNPANEYIVVELDVNNSDPKYFELTDSRGSVLIVQQLNNNRTTINTSHISPGIYFYTIRTSSGQLLKAGNILITR